MSATKEIGLAVGEQVKLNYEALNIVQNHLTTYERMVWKVRFVMKWKWDKASVTAACSSSTYDFKLFSCVCNSESGWQDDTMWRGCHLESDKREWSNNELLVMKFREVMNQRWRS